MVGKTTLLGEIPAVRLQEGTSSKVSCRPNNSTVEFGGLSAPTIQPPDQVPIPLPDVPVHPLPGRGLVSAAGAEPPPPRLALPAVQHAPDSPAPPPDPSIASDLPAGESPLETPLPSVVEPGTEPAPEIPAGPAVTSSPGRRSDLPVARRLGLGAPLQRVPNAGSGQSTDGITVQRQVEVDAQPTDVAPTTWSAKPDLAIQRTVDTPGGGLSTVQRRAEVDAEPTDVAPLVSHSPPMASAAASPMSSGSSGAAATPSDPLAARSRPSEPSPSPGPSTRPAKLGLPVQRAVDTTPQPGSRPMQQPSAGPITATPLATPAAPAGGGSSARSVDDPAESSDMSMPPIASPLAVDQPLPAGMDHTDAHPTVTYDSVAPAVVGLVGDRPIEPVISDYAAAADSAAIPVAAPAAGQSRWPAVQRRTASAGVPGVAAVQSPAVHSTVQRSMGAGTTPAASWPPGVLPVQTHRARQPDTPGNGRSSSGIERPASPTQPVQFAAEPIAFQTTPPELTMDRTRSCRHPVVTAADCQRRKSRGDTPTLHPGIQGPGR